MPIIIHSFIMEFVYENTKNIQRQTLISRHLTETCIDLFQHEKSVGLNKEKLCVRGKGIKCYPCGRSLIYTHPIYVYSCNKCGNLFQKERTFTRDLSENVSLVIGGRTKIGHQTVLKLLRCNSTVILTTRHPETAKNIFKKYLEIDDKYLCKNIKEKLFIYPESFDLDIDDLEPAIESLQKWILKKFRKLDIFIHVAAQTIRCRERPEISEDNHKMEKNRYEDPKYVDEKYTNSWQMRLQDLNQKEMEEVTRINSIAPCLMVKNLMPVLKLSNDPYIINVNSREGLFEVRKSPYHVHLNMAKGALAQMHLTLCNAKLKNFKGTKIKIHLCDPGWISVDEYYENSRPWIIPPLDEVDGASRILYPILRKLSTSIKTRRHYNYLTF